MPETYRQWEARRNAAQAQFEKKYGTRNRRAIMQAMIEWSNKPENKKPDGHSISTYRPPLPSSGASGTYYGGGHQTHHFGR